MKRKAVMWTLDEGLEILRNLQEDVRQFNYHIAIGGGVVNEGSSRKDLDLFFLSMNNGKPKDPEGLLEFLAVEWGAPTPIGENYLDAPDRAYSHKVSFYVPNGRIDAFIV